jgi:hypothetical protein
MLRACTLLCATLLIISLPVSAALLQDQPAQEKGKAVTMTGTVKSFEPGKAIVVDAKGVPHSYDLTAQDATFTISPDVKVGSQVKLTEGMDSSGRKTVTIEPAGK